MPAAVFISYSSKDQKEAETVCSALEGRGFSCWIAVRDVHAGEDFQEAIVTAIEHAKAMVQDNTHLGGGIRPIGADVARAHWRCTGRRFLA